MIVFIVVNEDNLQINVFSSVRESRNGNYFSVSVLSLVNFTYEKIFTYKNFQVF